MVSATDVAAEFLTRATVALVQDSLVADLTADGAAFALIHNSASAGFKNFLYLAPL